MDRNALEEFFLERLAIFERECMRMYALGRGGERDTFFGKGHARPRGGGVERKGSHRRAQTTDRRAGLTAGRAKAERRISFVREVAHATRGGVMPQNPLKSN